MFTDTSDSFRILLKWKILGIITFITVGFILCITIYAMLQRPRSQPDHESEFGMQSVKHRNAINKNPSSEEKLTHVASIKKAKKTYGISRNSPFAQLVIKSMSKDNTILLSIFDSVYADVAINLYATSFVPFGITNYLFIGLENTACQMLAKQKAFYGNQQRSMPGPACITYFTDAGGSTSSIYGSEGFKRKTHYKTQVILDVLRLGVNVVIVDIDIVFFKNPLPYFTCTSCDIEIQNDILEGNSGFYMVRPTPASIALHERTIVLGQNLEKKLSNQKALALALDSMTEQGLLNVLMLSDSQFPCGKIYYEDKHIMFRNDISCNECVMVHNNWIVGKAAKVYRFKETGMWMVDNEGYYSNPGRKYILYENPLDFGPKENKTIEHETRALRAALLLGYLLHRTVILPTFSCRDCGGYGSCNNTRGRCALSSFYSIDAINAHFGDAYREHEFLRHPAVPVELWKNQSPLVLIHSGITKKYRLQDSRIDIYIQPSEQLTLDERAPAEIIGWFVNTTAYSVLRFHSLYGLITTKLQNGTKTYRTGYNLLRSKINSELAFVRTNYRQEALRHAAER